MESRLERHVLIRELCARSHFWRPVTLLLMLASTSLLSSLSYAQDDDKKLLEDIVSPDIERRDIDESKIDSENIEIGFFAGVLSVEDFGSNDVYGGRIALHITEDVFVEANVGISTLQETTYELFSGDAQFLEEDERELTYYSLSLGYNLFPGEIYMGRWAFNSNFYVVGGAGSTLFADNEYFTYHFGGGLRVFLTDWVALRTDFRNHVLTHAIFGDDKEIQNLEMLIGATIYF